jgi:hypothetical protein
MAATRRDALLRKGGSFRMTSPGHLLGRVFHQWLRSSDRELVGHGVDLSLVLLPHAFA